MSLDLPQLLATLKMAEGWKPRLYQDSTGNPTYGYGHLASQPITLIAGEQILEDDAQTATAALNGAFPWWTGLPTPAANALAELSFNLGIVRLQGFVQMLAALERGDYTTAAAEALNSLADHQEQARIARIAAQIRSAATVGVTS